MKVMWAPWRMEYILDPQGDGCFFCKCHRSKQDKKNLIIHRSDHSFLILNKFPYNYAHLMIAPYRHTSDLKKLKGEEKLDVFNLVESATQIVKKASKPDGFNIGINIGLVAGAGVKNHIHLHIVPRWNGDTNFMPMLAETKVMPQHLEATYNALTAAKKKLKL